MNERLQLYNYLRRQIVAAIPILKSAELISDKIKIGNIEIKKEEFLAMICEFSEVQNLSFEKKFNNIRTNCIPISLINNNIFFKEIQITMNKIRKEQVEYLYQEEER